MSDGAQTESQLMDAIFLALGSTGEILLHRNNCGMAWMRNGSPVKFGVGNPGGSDLVGVHRGRAVYVEIKTPTGRQSVEQKRFQQCVERHGGIYIILRSVDDALAWLARMREADLVLANAHGGCSCRSDVVGCNLHREDVP